MSQGAAAHRAGDSPSQRPFRRVLIKISGEILGGPRGWGVDLAVLSDLAGQIRDVAAAGTQAGIVIGGGNIYRGVATAAEGMDRAVADQMGMLGTVINALALQDVLERTGVPTRVMTAIAMSSVAEPYIRRRAIRHLEKGRVVVLAAGTGHPFFTTDTAAALRALEIGAEALLKGTKVDGVYSADPVSDPTARRYERLTASEAIDRRLRVMDITALTMCRDNSLPVIVFDLLTHGNLRRVTAGESVGTLVTPE